MKMTVLGCGDAFGSEGRFNTSFYLEEGNHKLLVDCGASTLIRLKQLRIPVDQIDTVIITHFHGDHYGGLPFLMISNWIEYQRTTPLTIIGPKNIKEKAIGLQEALYPGTTNVIESMDITFKEFEDFRWVNHKDISIYARMVSHAPPSNPHGVKVKIGEKVFAFSGDTEWNDSLIDIAEASDAFVVECNNYSEDSPGHLSYKTIMEKKDLFNTKKIYLTHMGSEVIGQSQLELERLEDGMVLEI
jgi:ribonuclease BN (tRNA processing enzyme)